MSDLAKFQVWLLAAGILTMLGSAATFIGWLRVSGAVLTAAWGTLFWAFVSAFRSHRKGRL